jgi:hypothetical protein
VPHIDELLKRLELLDMADHETVYHLMTPQPSKGQHRIPSRTSLWHEVRTNVIAGSDTVGNAVTLGTFHILNSEPVSAKLVQELQVAWPDTDAKLGREALEKLPYLVSQSLIQSLIFTITPDGSY